MTINATTDTTPTSQFYLLATMLHSFLETRTRESGESFVCLADNAPEWCYSIVRLAHDSSTIGELMPDDYRYRMIAASVEALVELCNLPGAPTPDELDDAKYGLDSPLENFELLKWLSSHLSRASFCDAYCQDMARATDTMGSISDGYRYEQWEVFDAVVDGLRRQAAK